MNMESRVPQYCTILIIIRPRTMTIILHVCLDFAHNLIMCKICCKNVLKPFLSIMSENVKMPAMLLYRQERQRVEMLALQEV